MDFRAKLDFFFESNASQARGVFLSFVLDRTITISVISFKKKKINYLFSVNGAIQIKYKISSKGWLSND